MTQEEISKRTILRGLIGSTVHGLNLEGTDDRDEMGVCVESIRMALGNPPFEQFISRSAEERAREKGDADPAHARSQAGDLDLVVYSLRKFIRLALDGNPTILNLLFVPQKFLVGGDDRGAELQQLAPLIISREASKRYLGYMVAQRQRLLGERGQKSVNRPELVDKYGHDTKYAMHMLRLGFQGIELLEAGSLTLPMTGDIRSYLMDVRVGKIDLQSILTTAGELEKKLEDLKTSSPIRDGPDRESVEKWVAETYLQTWKRDEYDAKLGKRSENGQ